VAFMNIHSLRDHTSLFFSFCGLLDLREAAENHWA